MSRRKKIVRDPSIPPVETAPKPDADRLRPWLLGATVAMFVARPLFPSESIGDTGEGIPLVMLALVLAAVWAVGMARRGRPWRWGATDVAVLALLALHSISAVWAAGHGHARPAVNVLWQWIGLGLGFFLLRQLVHTRREVRAVAAVMIALAVVLSTYGLWQYAYEFPRHPGRVRAEPGRNAPGRGALVSARLGRTPAVREPAG